MFNNTYMEELKQRILRDGSARAFAWTSKGAAVNELKVAFNDF